MEFVKEIENTLHNYGICKRNRKYFT